MDVTLSLVTDFIVIIMLGVTVFYVLRLSRALSAFKQHRAEFETLMNTLSKQIENAYATMDNLKKTGASTAQELGDAVSEAKYMLDELKLVNEASDNLAYRLEGLVDKSRQNRVDAEQEAATSDRKSWSDSLKTREKEDASAASSPFSIRDPDYEGPSSDGDVVTDVDFKKNEKRNTTADDRTFSSQAEKDLYESLQKNKKG